MFLLDDQQVFSIVYAILLGLLGLLFVCSIVFFIIRLVRIQKKAKASSQLDGNEYLEALGGKDNIISINRNLSRITFKVKDVDSVNTDQLKSLGASGILLVGDEIKCSFNELSENIYKIIKGDK